MVLFVKRYGFDIFLYRVPYQRWGVYGKSNERCGAYSRAAFIRVAARNRSFTVTTLLLGTKKLKIYFVTWEENLSFIGPFVSNRY